MRQLIFFFIGFTFMMTGCSSSVDALEDVPQRVLLSSPEGLVLDGRQITLNASLNRDFSPNSPPDGRPLIARVEVIALNGENLPERLDADALWVVVENEVWGSSFSDEWFEEEAHRIVKIARDGPKFGVGKKAEVIVRLRYKGGDYLLRASGQEIKQSM